MQGIEAIVAEIIAAAQAEAEETVRKAEAFKADRLSELEKRLLSENSEREAGLAREAENVLTRRLTLAGLEARMAALGAKQSVLAEAFELALRKALAWDDAKYRAFFARLVASVASDGDGVRVAASDAKRLDRNWLDETAAKAGKKLVLLPEPCDGAGGVLVVGASSEIDLTLETLIAEIRRQSEREVLRALFGDAT